EGMNRVPVVVGRNISKGAHNRLRIAPCATTFPKFASLGFGIEDFSKSKSPQMRGTWGALLQSWLEVETTPGYRGGSFKSEDAVVADPGAFADSPPVVGFDVRSRLTDSF